MRETGNTKTYGDGAIAHEVLEALEEEGDFSRWHLSSINGVVGGSIGGSVCVGLALHGSLRGLLWWHLPDLRL